MAFLFNSNLSYSSIVSRLSAISFWIRAKGWSLVTQSHLVFRALRGVRALSFQSGNPKFPITPDVLNSLCSYLPSAGFSNYEVICFRAMFLLAFHAFLRVGELCGSKHALQLSDVSLHDSYLAIHFASFKFSCGRYPKIFIPARPYQHCPVKAMREYLSKRGLNTGPLFLDHDGKPLSISSFRASLKRVVKTAGLSSKGISPHSFRIGAATTAAALGIPDETIQRMGRWTSRAFLRYIRFHVNKL